MSFRRVTVTYGPGGLIEGDVVVIATEEDPERQTCLERFFAALIRYWHRRMAD